jgi:hypothetical protein
MAAATVLPPSASRVASLVEARLERKGCLNKYTLSEVAKHNTKDDAWVVVGGRVRVTTCRRQGAAGCAAAGSP